MKRLILFSAVVLLLSAAVAVSRVSAQVQGYICVQGFPTDWTTYGGAPVEWGAGRWFLPGALAENAGNPIMLAKADYSVEAHAGLRGIRSITISWAFTGFTLELAETGVQLIRGGALVDSYVEQHPTASGVQTFTATFSDRPIDYLSSYIRYSTLQGSLASIALRVEEVCYYSARQDPTPTFIYTRTPTLTPSHTAIPSDTPVPTATPINFTPSVTMVPTINMPTMESRGFASPVAPGDGCEDLTRPCALWGLPKVSTLSLALPSSVPAWDTLTPIPSYTYAYVPGGIGGGTGTPTPTPGGGLGDVIPPPLGTLSSDGIDQFSALATETFYGDVTGTGSGDGIDLRNAGYEIGANISALFGYARMLVNADLGRVGTILSYLLLLIAFNLMLRVLLFIVPILFTIFRLIVDIIQAVVSAIDAVIPF